MQTHLSIDLDLVAEDHQEELCIECQAFPMFFPESVATWHLVLTSTCTCLPNPMPICEHHKVSVDDYLVMYGSEDWMCHLCGHRTEVVEVRRIKAN